MKKLLPIIFLFISGSILAQDAVELTPNGFGTVTFAKPNRPLEDLMTLTNDWAYVYNKRGHDTYNVTANSLTIDAMRNNAFYFMNLGEQMVFKIKYSLDVSFIDDKCVLKFTVKEIYNNDKIIKSTIADYFRPDGTIKEDFEEVKPSLEKTANDLIASFANYINR